MRREKHRQVTTNPATIPETSQNLPLFPRSVPRTVPKEHVPGTLDLGLSLAGLLLCDGNCDGLLELYFFMNSSWCRIALAHFRRLPVISIVLFPSHFGDLWRLSVQPGVRFKRESCPGFVLGFGKVVWSLSGGTTASRKIRALRGR